MIKNKQKPHIQEVKENRNNTKMKLKSNHNEKIK